MPLLTRFIVPTDTPTEALYVAAIFLVGVGGGFLMMSVYEGIAARRFARLLAKTRANDPTWTARK